MLITLAKAADTANGGQAGGAGLLMFLPLILIFALMYFMMIRPQKKREKEEKKMRDNLQVGDELLTIGGIYGRVISLKEDAVVIESKSDHSKLTIARWAIQQNLTIHADTNEK